MQNSRWPAVRLISLTTMDAVASGEGLDIACATVDTVFGDCFIAASAMGICYLGFPAKDAADDLVLLVQRQWPKATVSKDVKRIQVVARSIFSAQADSVVDVLVKGTPFQIKVWQALLAIPYGASCAYADIAGQINQPDAARAVGSAVGKNPVSLLVPCHRVLPRGGGVGNYLWGSACKQKILASESRVAAA